MIYNKIRIDEVLTETNITQDWAISGNLGDDFISIITSPDCGNILLYKYGERYFYKPDNSVLSDYGFLLKLWRIWLDGNKTDYLRMYAALESEYNPISNYDSHEVVTTQHGHILTDKSQPGVKTTSTNEFEPGITDTTESGIYGYNSAAASNADKVVNTKTGKDKNTNTIERTGLDTDTHTHSGTDTVTSEKSGNIGVTTSQQMIESEVALRLKDYVDRIIKCFIDEYTTY
jgi:hypothetical protein